MEDGDYNYQEAIRKMLHRKEHHRAYEEIIHVATCEGGVATSPCHASFY